MEFIIECENPWFNLIKEGKKTIEGRINNNKYNKIKNCDIIQLVNHENNDSIKLLVTTINKYNTFADMLEHETLDKVLPNIDTLEEGIQIYRKYYKLEVEIKKGVLAIAFQLM